MIRKITYLFVNIPNKTIGSNYFSVEYFLPYEHETISRAKASFRKMHTTPYMLDPVPISLGRNFRKAKISVFTIWDTILYRKINREF